MVALSALAFILALAAGVVIVLAATETDYAEANDKPQRFHLGHVPRLGGLAMGISLAISLLIGTLFEEYVSAVFNLRLRWQVVLLWILVMSPAFIVGLIEDVTQRSPVLYRLLATTVTALLACYLLDLEIARLDVVWLDSLLNKTPFLGVFLAVLAISGLPHAFNIIDGYNGLAGMVALGVCLALAYVALQIGDRALASWILALAGATVGFLIWNYPKGLIFAGDGGAYLWGILIALVCVALVQRNPSVSPWFPLLLLIYPVWETLFSIYRKTVRGVSPAVADALHFHQLIYRRLVRGVFHDDDARQVLMRNNRTSPYLWSFIVLTALPAVLFWQNSAILIGFCILFVISYVAAYLTIIRFKVPGWVSRRHTKRRKRHSRHSQMRQSKKNKQPD